LRIIEVDGKKEEACCASCPAFEWLTESAADREGRKPEDLHGDCTAGPKTAVCVKQETGRGSDAKIVQVRSQMRGNEHCMMHPLLVLEMDSEIEEEDDEEEEDEG